MKAFIIGFMLFPVFCYAQNLEKSVSDSNNVANTSIQLKEVVVRAGRIYRKSDRFVMQVPSAANKNSEELLRQAPGVSLSSNDISINGESGTKVFVDEREIRLTGEAFIAYLRSLSSEDIRRIEVQPMSDAAQDADTKGGIIHIYLRKRSDRGAQGNVSMESIGASSLRDYRPSVSLTAHSGKWDVYSSASCISRPKDKGNMQSNRTYAQANNNFDSYSRIIVPYHYGTARLGAIYTIDTLRSVGAEVEYIRSSTNLNTNNHSTLSENSQIFESNGSYGQKSIYNMYSVTTNYQQKLDQKGSLFNIIADYVRKRSTGDNWYNIYQKWNNNDTIYRSRMTSIYDIASTDISLKKCLARGTSFRMGAKFTYTNMNDRSNYDALSADNKWNALVQYAYSLDYSEDIWAGYAIYSADFGKWSIDAGIRLEYTKTTDHTNHFDKKYGDLYPHLTINYSFDDLHRWMLSYQLARNIERPAFYTLNPNRIQTSEYAYQIGNPALKPTYINKMSATLIFDYRYTLTIGGNMNRNLIREFCKQDADNTEISYITYENHLHENHWFVAVNAPVQPFTWLNLNVNVIGVRQCIQMTSGSPYNNHNLLFFNSTATCLLPFNYTMELQYNAHSRLFSGNSEVAPFGTLNLSLKKKWNDGKWVATASVDNLLNQSICYRSRLDAYITNTTYHLASNGRIFKFAIAWNFNSGKKVKQRKLENSSSAERNRFNQNM